MKKSKFLLIYGFNFKALVKNIANICLLAVFLIIFIILNIIFSIFSLQNNMTLFSTSLIVNAILLIIQTGFFLV